MLIDIMDGDVLVRTIVADEAFAEQHYPGAWRVAAQQDVPVIPATPQSCTPAQGLIALYELRGVTDADIVSMINAIADPVEQYHARIAYTRTSDWQRTHPVIVLAAQQLSLTSDDIDALFAHAASVIV